MIGILGTQKLTDDILVVGRTKNELLERVELVQEQCKEHKIMVNDSKMQLETEMRFTRNINGKNIDTIYNLQIQRIRAKLIGYQTKLLWTGSCNKDMAQSHTRACQGTEASAASEAYARINDEKFN